MGKVPQNYAPGPTCEKELRLPRQSRAAPQLLLLTCLHHYTSTRIRTSPDFWKVKPNTRFCLGQENYNQLTSILWENCSNIRHEIHCNTVEKCRKNENELDGPSGSLYCPALPSAIDFSSPTKHNEFLPCEKILNLTNLVCKFKQ